MEAYNTQYSDILKHICVHILAQKIIVILKDDKSVLSLLTLRPIDYQYQ
jgi:hypothetical protein